MRIIGRLVVVAAVAAFGAVVSAAPVVADPGIGASPGGPSGLAPGTIYEPAPGAPAFGPLPPPAPVFLPAAIGLPPGAVVDSISYGDATVQLGISPFHVLFSVAPGSTGHPASLTTGPHGTVFDDSTGGDGSVAGDIYVSDSVAAPATPFGAFAPFFPPSPCGPIESNNQTADENGLGPFPFALPNVGLGLVPGDNLDKLEVLDNTAVDFIPPGGNGMPDAPIFFSLDGPTAAALPPLPPFFGPNSAADVYAWDPVTAMLYDWMPFFAMGLTPGDDIDALEVGHISGVPVSAGYTGFPDIVFFSLTPGSPSLGGLATGCFPPGFATGGDIFAAFGGPPVGAIDAEMLGLNTMRSGGPADDDLDAFDFVLAASSDLDGDGIDDAADFDRDGDGAGNLIDNCPDVANPGQTNTDGSNSALNRAGQDGLGDACDTDDDGDGYLDSTETGLGKNPLTYCTIMRADVDGDGVVSIIDLSKVALSYLKTIPPAPERRNQDGDTVISILDLAMMASVYLKPITPCP